MIRRQFRFWSSLYLCVVVVNSSFPQGYTPEIAASKMTVPDGFEVRLVVAEPLLRQPVAIDFDDRGRLWAIQYLQYPNPAGLKRVKVDRYSRTVYDRVPEPPPRGPKGADRITIYNIGPDGRATQAKDFVSGLNLASGFAIGYGGVFVLQAPYLLFYPDRDGNDVPDGDPDVLLSGFGMEDAHSVANSLTWGPDGWLYGCQGSTVTAKIRGIEFQQGVWRYHPITHKFELFCEGGGNSWGLDFDATGQLLYSTNLGGFVMLHGVQGGYYWKSFGKHGALHNPYAYGYFDHVPHEGFRGGHVTVGGTIYQGTSFPASFRGKYIAGDLLGHAVHWHDIAPRGSTFRTRHGQTLLQANDTWFAPSDVTMGPDGAIYVADWHDKRTAHPDPDAEWDRTNGRVYRIAAKGTKSVALPDFKKLPSADLVRLLGHENDWLVRRARLELARRRDPEVIFPLRSLIFETKDEHLALEALWALYVSGGFSNGFAAQALGHRVPAVREWAVRLIGDEGRVTPAILRGLMTIARSEPDVRVCCQLACSAKRLPPASALLVIRALAARDEFAADLYLTNLLWWALERHAVSARSHVLTTFASTALWRAGPTARELLERLMRRYASEGTEQGDAACFVLLETAPGDSGLAAINRGWKDRPFSAPRGKPSFVEVSRDLSEAISQRLWYCPQSALAFEMLLRIGDGRAQWLLGDQLSDLHTRGLAIRLIGEIGLPGYVPVLLRCLSNTQAIRALGSFDDPTISPALLRELPAMTAEARAVTLDVLSSRRPWAMALLKWIDAGRFPAKDVPLDLVRGLANFNDKSIDALVRKHWGQLKSATPEEKLAEVRRFNNDLRAADGDARRGREIFRKSCANCHTLFGEGEKVGPDLTTANRKDRDYLLVSIVDPSAVIRKEYVSHVVQTTDGRSLTGLLVEQTPARVTLLTAKNERVALERSRIESLDESPVSLMPDDLLKPLSPQELRDLFKYLQSDQAP